jgi:hypothetical protein
MFFKEASFMQVPFFLTSFIFVVIWFTYQLRKSDRNYHLHKSNFEEFLDSEMSANLSRKKDIHEDIFIQIDDTFISHINSINFSSYPNPKNFNSQKESVVYFADKKLVKFCTPKTNKQIKVEFGIANFDLLVSYEENYNNFINTTLNFAYTLMENDSYLDAIFCLNYLISLNHDSYKCFKALADCYMQLQDTQSLNTLKKDIQSNAITITSNNKDKILIYIEENKTT